MNATRLLPRTVQLCGHCQHNPAGFWVSRASATLVRRPWCLACCAELDRSRYHVTGFDAAQHTGHSGTTRRTTHTAADTECPGSAPQHRPRTLRAQGAPGYPLSTSPGPDSAGTPPNGKETVVTSTPPARYAPAWWRAAGAFIATAIVAVGAAAIPAAAAGAAPAAAAPSGPAMRERQAPGQNIAIAASGVHTTTISSPVPALPARYHYQTVALPGYPSVYINGISGSGGYAGEGCKDRNCTKVALFAASPAGKITFYTLPFHNYSPNGPFNTTATGMDNAGDVVGGYTDAKGGFHGFVRSASGVLTQINDPRAAAGGTVADGISPDGSVITGLYLDKAEAEHGFLLRGSTFTTYDVPGAAGTVVAFDTPSEFGGTYYTASGASRGFYVLHGRLHTLRAPAQPGARHPALTLSAADAHGALFGYATSANLPGYGIAYAHGRYTTFRDPHQAGTGPQAGTVIYSANTDGVVAGAYTYTNGTATQFPYAHGFIARPDPSTHPPRTPRRP